MTTPNIHARFSCTYPDFNLNVDVSMPGSGITALFGASGCGKTTLLRCMAGLQKTDGHLSVLGDIWQSDTHFTPVHQRPLAYVFQETHLFPHLSVHKNLTFGQRRVADRDRKITIEEAVSWLGLESLMARMPSGLSGGERQRVAIARALLTSPRLLLMDEPLSALDQPSKQDILPYLERLRDHLAIPILYVSHSVNEVARLANHIVMMKHGRIVAQGPLQETLARVDQPFQLEDEAGIIVQATLDEIDTRWHLARFRFDGGELWLRQDERLNVGEKARIQVLARDVSIALSPHRDQSIQNLLQAQVDQVETDVSPGTTLVRLMAGNTPFLARLTSRSAAQLGLAPGQSVWLQIKSVALVD
ncbi:molybdenum ABC transporter ATP-binding protein [Marinobacter daepoensis]|uniref:molybdenum ABC transporter ATP-binding protein n=1 Tax=Marinobacter daepoensis TaxID=262077 RepID=UPI000404E7E4|nr:molybdenum ABC transporter ATP-binding protein [Marinobacter daepoensis]